jgi:hypothetical protein
MDLNHKQALDYKKIHLEFQDDTTFILNYSEEQFRHYMSNINTNLTVSDLKEIINEIYLDISSKITAFNKKEGKDHVKRLTRDNKIVYYKRMQVLIEESKKDLLKKFINTYYNSWLVIEQN